MPQSFREHTGIFALLQKSAANCGLPRAWTGVNVAGEDNPFSWVLLNGIFLVGSYVFAVVLGLVSDDTSQELKVCNHYGLHLLLLPLFACHAYSCLSLHISDTPHHL